MAGAGVKVLGADLRRVHVGRPCLLARLHARRPRHRLHARRPRHRLHARRPRHRLHARDPRRARRRGEPRDLAGVGDLARGEAELGGHLVHVLPASERPPQRDALGEAGERRLDHHHSVLVEAQRGLARGGAQQRPLGQGAERVGEARAVGGADPLQVLEAQPPPLQPRGERGVGQQLLRGERLDVEQQHPRAERGGEQQRGVGAGDQHGQVAGRGEQAVQLSHRGALPANAGMLAGGECLPASVDLRSVVAQRRRERPVEVHAPQARLGRGRVQARAEQQRGEPVGHLDEAVGERPGGVSVEQPDRAGAAQRRGVGEAREDRVAGPALGGEQPRDQPRGGELARDVVVQVREQPPVAGAELGGRAHREHLGVELPERQRPRGGGDAAVELVDRCGVRE